MGGWGSGVGDEVLQTLEVLGMKRGGGRGEMKELKPYSGQVRENDKNGTLCLDKYKMIL